MNILHMKYAVEVARLGSLNKVAENKKLYKDVLIYRDVYKLSNMDRQFITELCEARRKYLK